MTAYVFLAEGFEEVEALTPVDILRRGGVTVKTVAIGGGTDRIITGSHGVSVVCDIAEEAVVPDEIDMMVLPGGLPGTGTPYLQCLFLALQGSQQIKSKGHGIACAVGGDNSAVDHQGFGYGAGVRAEGI